VSRAPAREKLEESLERYGHHTASYVLLEGSKQYLTASGIDGFLAWETRFGCPIVAGDPVCSLDDAPELLRRVRRRYWPRPVFAYAVSARLVPAYRDAGFAVTPVGAEPIFDPVRFSLAGGARATVRAAVNHAVKAGVVFSQHDPLDAGAGATNAELSAVSAEWLASRGDGELAFLLGSPQLAARTRKRYFVARSASRIEAFLVCEPILARRGWYLDVTRRRRDAARGTMELLTTAALRVLGEEGVARVSTGLAPLSRLELGAELANDSSRLLELFQRAFGILHAPYDFAGLARYKAKYAPDDWEPAFFCFAGAGAERATAWILERAIRRATLQGETVAPQDAQ
jgi:phosphatidylglycerol lysyltransferase